VTRKEVAQRLGWRKDAVRSIEDIALAKLRILMGIGTREDFLMAKRRLKTCSKCGTPGHQKDTCL
jgi:hypothetical protein